ncbi:MAG: hypothetical protein CVU09_01375 [Bacteroidetes bacterium HGW-Bacteroidetes-4]|jgi:hypothetical protein|nr:MAG: hypothetical protein CVU09_01375 [Bacteroidetes bacterium HGW-Bacteroidetes-4]
MKNIRIIGLGLILFGYLTTSGQVTLTNENFNAGDNGWTATSNWVRDAASFPGNDGAHWHTTPFNNYTDNMTAIVTSSTYDFTGYGNISLSVDVRYNTEADWDGFRIEYTIDGGATWNVLGSVGEGVNWYNDTDVDAIANGADGWSGDNAGWQTTRIDFPSALNNASAVKFRLLFKSDNYVTGVGVAFDNFILEGYQISTILSHNFNTGDDGWTTSSGWIWNASSFDGNTSSHWHTNPYNNYNNNMQAFITSSTIDLSGKTNLKLSFDLRFDTSNDLDDGLTLQYSPDNGSTWNTLGSVGEGTNWFNDADVDGIANGANGWTGNNSQWQNASIQLPAVLENNAQVKFRFLFGSDANNTDDGVAFDNFEINQFFTVIPPPAKTWYAYSTNGNWTNSNSWTLDGATNPLYVNPGNVVPGTNDYVIIPSGKKITIDATTNNLNALKIVVNGELDVTSSRGHNFNVIAGNGIISMAGYDPGIGAVDNFPAGTTTLFNDATLGGTVKVYGAGITLNNPRTFNKLDIASSGTTTLLANYTINSQLKVTSGTFRINNNTNTTPLKLTVNGDVMVDAGAAISVGTANASDNAADIGYGNFHKYYHVFTVKGNFSNYGTVRFTNQTRPDFNTRTNNGAVSLVFSGATSNTLLCEGTTDLYYLVIDKGTDQTYSLTINATNKAYFALYGDNNADWNNSDPNNPENRKALWIKAGTLILEGHVYIPTLTEDSNWFQNTGTYSIGENAALILNGDKVYVGLTALTTNSGVHSAIDYTGLSFNTSSAIDDSRREALYLYGTLKINAGTFETSNSQGIVYRAESPSVKFEMHGGLVRTGQFRISAYADKNNAKISYIQTGGELKLLDNFNFPTTAEDVAIFDLSAELGSFTMSGGTISIHDLTPRTGGPNAIEIGCDAGNIDVSGGTFILDNTIGTSAVAGISTTAPLHNFILRNNQNNAVRLSQALQINNNLSIENETFNANGFDLKIGSDLIIALAGTYTPGTNTTTFFGPQNSNLNVQKLQEFYNVTIAKSADKKDFKIQAGPTVAMQVNNTLRIEKGAFDIGVFNASLKGDIYLADSVGKKANSGKVICNGTLMQNMTSINGVIKNIELNNAQGVSLTGDLNIIGTLALTNGVFDINTAALTMLGSDAQITGTFGAGRMIQTNGNSSDGGLELFLDGNKTLTFPLGTDANASGALTPRYTPAELTFTNVIDSGYVKISIADAQIPMTIANGGDIISYYWKVRHYGFENLPTVSTYEFIHASFDEDGKNTSSYVGGFVLDETPYSQGTDSYNKNTRTITFDDSDDPVLTLAKASFSAGSPNRFKGKPDVYYSRYTSGGYNWNNKDNWYLNEIGTTSNKVPQPGSIVIIRDSVRINVDNAAAFEAPGAVIFESNYTVNPNPDSENVPRLQFLTAGTFALGTVTGTGMISFDAPANPVVTGDFGEFGRNTDSYYLYFGGNATLNAIPTPIPNLMVESGTYSINQDVDINGSLIIQLGAIAAPLQNTNIDHNLIIGANNGGTYRFPSQATAITTTVGGNIDFTYNPIGIIGTRSLIVQPDNLQNVEHKLILKGDIIQGSESTQSIDLWRANNTERVVLELQGNTDNEYTRTSTSVPEFYRIVLNKGNTQTNSFTFNQSFTLGGATNSLTSKALELLNGSLLLNATDLNINLTTGNPFSIPSTSALFVNSGTVNATGTNGGIKLDGKLSINGGTVNVTSAANDANYIEYGASGNSILEITDGVLHVGTQIRRQTANDAGVLKYYQTGGDVVVGLNTGDNGYATNRGVFEIVNSGSNFTFTGGNLTLVRQNGVNPTEAALLLNPATYNLSGSTIFIGHANTPEAQNKFQLNVSIPLNNLTIAVPATLSDGPNIINMVGSLTVAGNLSVSEKATFDGNGFDLNLGGDYINNGSYIANNNTLRFYANNKQVFSGFGQENIYKLHKSGTDTLQLEKNINVNNTLTVSKGVLHSGNNTINTWGNVVNDATITNTSGAGLVFMGNTTQLLSRSTLGTSYISTLTINNANNVEITTDDQHYVISNKLRLQNGVFNIRGSLLELGVNAQIEPVAPYSLNNMVQTNSSFQDKGIKKNFPANFTSDFIFPVGQLVYTPVTIDLNSDALYTTGTTPGSVTIRPVNELHPTVNDGTNTLTTGDINNVLKYYWILKTENISGLKSKIKMKFDESDMLLTEPGYAETDYIGARILTFNNTSEAINKYTDPEAVDEINHEVIFTFNGENSDGISGDYFAGIDPAIPDNVATYTTQTSGNVNQSTTYVEGLTNDGVAPSGVVLVVSTGNEITFNVDEVKLYKTIIQENATLTINETSRHRLGTVTGTGNLKIVSNTESITFPAGDYIDFFGCTGGGLEYAGAGSYTVLGNITSLRNVVISGTGIKTLANNNLNVCEDFILNGPVFDNADENITVNGNLNLVSGTFYSGTNNAIVVNGGVALNGATYEGETSGADRFGSLTINSGSFKTGSGGSVSILGNLIYSGGSFNGGSGSSAINLIGTTPQNLTGNFTGTAKMFTLGINNTAGIIMNGNVTIGNRLNLTNGVVTPGANTLLLESAATVSPATGSTTSHINGRLSKTLAAAGSGFTFPVGKSGRLGYALISEVSAAGDTWSVEYFTGAATNEAGVTGFVPTSTDIVSVSEKEYWKITDNLPAGSRTAKVGLSWNSFSRVSETPDEREKLETMVWNGTTWDNIGGSFPTSHTPSSGYLVSTTSVSFSEKIATLGSSDLSNPLPVIWLSFYAKANLTNVALAWATASEKDNDYFEVERSLDGIEFTAIGRVYGAGNTMVQKNYNFTDDYPLTGTAYYRLKQVDFNGEYDYSKTIAVYFEGSQVFDDNSVAIYPNPFKDGDLTLELKSVPGNTPVTIKVTSLTGHTVYLVKLNAPEHHKVNLIPMAMDRLPQGIYFINISTEKKTITKRLVVH